jgi:hypothetical protein
MFRGTDNIMWNIHHIHECEEFSLIRTVFYEMFLTFRLNARNILTKYC